MSPPESMACHNIWDKLLGGVKEKKMATPQATFNSHAASVETVCDVAKATLYSDL